MGKMAIKKKQRKLVLIVEDQIPMQDSLRIAFTRSNEYHYTLLFARSVSQAVQTGQGRTKALDALVIDLHLLGDSADKFSGFQFVQRADWPGIPLIIYSGNNTLSNFIKAAILRADLFLDKSYSPSALVEAVDQIFQARERQQQSDDEARAVLARHGEWFEKYAGKFVAIVGDEVVAAAPDRASLLLQYEKYRKGHSGVPEEPCIAGIVKKKDA